MKNIFANKWICIEGCDGSGKSFLIEKLCKYFKNEGISYISTREPGGTDIAEKIRNIIVNDDIDGITEAFLFATSRREHVKNKIVPNLINGKSIVCDRYLYSSLAYQGFARKLGIDFVYSLNMTALQGLSYKEPDIVIFLDVDPKVGLNRIYQNSNREINRLDREKLEFYERVRDGYLNCVNRFSEKFIVVNANQEPDKVFEEALIKMQLKLNK